MKQYKNNLHKNSIFTHNLNKLNKKISFKKKNSKMNRINNNKTMIKKIKIHKMNKKEKNGK